MLEISEKEIFEHIFANYSSQSRPKMDVRSPVNITIALRLSSITHFVSFPYLNLNQATRTVGI